MQIFAKTLDGRRRAVDVSAGATARDVLGALEASTGVPASASRLVSAGRQLAVDDAVPPGAEVAVSLRLAGGIIEPSLVILARKFNCDKLICRKCYARMHPRASNCRKKSCGRTSELRPKKKSK